MLDNVDYVLRPDAWQRRGAFLPTDTEIDILYVNPTFDPPVVGLIYNAMIEKGIATSATGASIIALYIEFWKYSEISP